MALRIRPTRSLAFDAAVIVALALAFSAALAFVRPQAPAIPAGVQRTLDTRQGVVGQPVQRRMNIIIRPNIRHLGLNKDGRGVGDFAEAVLPLEVAHQGVHCPLIEAVLAPPEPPVHDDRDRVRAGAAREPKVREAELVVPVAHLHGHGVGTTNIRRPARPRSRWERSLPDSPARWRP